MIVTIRMMTKVSMWSQGGEQVEVSIHQESLAIIAPGVEGVHKGITEDMAEEEEQNLQEGAMMVEVRQQWKVLDIAEKEDVTEGDVADQEDMVAEIGDEAEVGDAGEEGDAVEEGEIIALMMILLQLVVLLITGGNAMKSKKMTISWWIFPFLVIYRDQKVKL